MAAYVGKHTVLRVDQFDVNVQETDEYHRNLKPDPANLKIDIVFESHDGQLLDHSSYIADTRKNDNDVE